MPPTVLYVFMGIIVALIGGIAFAYFYIQKKMKNSDVARIEKLRQGTKRKSFNTEVLYQKLYVKYLKTPFVKRYLLKIRRRLEINNIDDEFLTRMQSAKIITRAIVIIIPLTIFVILLTHSNLLLMSILLIFELFIIDSFSDSMVDKLDNKLLTQQLNFFAAMRHAYHETNMVGEAIYTTAQESDSVEISRQAERIYEILNSQDPESELEKYYDIAPNNYLKEFAGISYLTQEFGDRKVEGNSSLYLKNLENITQEMQLEILKRDKLNYTFQSLSVIVVLPMLMIEPLKNWAVGNFSFTKPFYQGNKGMLVQLLIMIATFICYTLIRKLKDNGATKQVQDNQNPWQEKVYNIPQIKKIVDMFIPKEKTKEHRKLKNLLKDAGSSQKISWIYVNKLMLTVVVFIVSIFIMIQLHNIQISFIYNEPTTTYNLIGEMSGKEEAKAMETTRIHNIFLNKFRGNTKATIEDIESAMRKSPEFKTATDDEIKVNSKLIYSKLQTLNAEYLKWFEVLLSIVFATIGYAGPTLMLKFQVTMRRMEMEDEVMQYQTIIMMLMRIERVDVEMILEWLERYSDIFKGPISKCLNNYESGAWEALEEMKEEVSFQPFIRIIEGLQSSVEKLPIQRAFEELDSDRGYHKDKRKESNERLISRKGMIGKAIGFAPMIIIFVGYLIVPLVFIGMTSMMTSFDSISSMT